MPPMPAAIRRAPILFVKGLFKALRIAASRPELTHPYGMTVRKEGREHSRIAPKAGE